MLARELPFNEVSFWDAEPAEQAAPKTDKSRQSGEPPVKGFSPSCIGALTRARRVALCQKFDGFLTLCGEPLGLNNSENLTLAVR